MMMMRPGRMAVAPSRSRSPSQSLKSEVEHAAGRRLGIQSAEVLVGHASVLPPWLRAGVLRSHRPSSSPARSR